MVFPEPPSGSSKVVRRLLLLTCFIAAGPVVFEISILVNSNSASSRMDVPKFLERQGYMSEGGDVVLQSPMTQNAVMETLSRSSKDAHSERRVFIRPDSCYEAAFCEISGGGVMFHLGHRSIHLTAEIYPSDNPSVTNFGFVTDEESVGYLADSNDGTINSMTIVTKSDASMTTFIAISGEWYRSIEEDDSTYAEVDGVRRKCRLESGRWIFDGDDSVDMR